MTYYGYALQFDDDDLDVRYKLAEAARNFDSYTEAEEQYSYIVENDENMEFPLSTFHLGQVHQRQDLIVVVPAVVVVQQQRGC